MFWMTELDRLQDLLQKKTDWEPGDMWLRLIGKHGDSIQGYYKKEPSWVVFQDESGDGLLTYADPCDSYLSQTAEQIIDILESDE